LCKHKKPEQFSINLVKNATFFRPKLSSLARERSVPSTRLSRVLSFGSLGVGLGKLQLFFHPDPPHGSARFASSVAEFGSLTGEFKVGLKGDISHTPL
jgi:hypothetical protein